MSERTYRIDLDQTVEAFIQESESLLLRDIPERDAPIQVSYLNAVVGFFLRTFIKVYSSEDLSEEDRANLRRYLEKVFEAKDALMAKEPKRY